jgi:[protein-PII] uridylyltransferase
MSQTSQRLDISDPATIRHFTSRVKDRRRLDHLYLLTVADIAGTSPKLWNSWKSGLLWDLYSGTVQALEQGHEAPEDRRSRLDASHQVARETLLSKGFNEQTIEHHWNQLPEYALLRFSQQQLVWALGKQMSADESKVVVAIREAPGPGVSEVFVSAPDFDGLFATVTALFDEMGLNVLSARVTTTRDHRSFDLFELTDRHGKPLQEPDTVELSRRLSEPLRECRVVAPVQRKLPRRLRPFVINPRIRFGQAREGSVSTMEVRCTDRPGLLSQLADAMVSCGIRVHDARIATYGDHLEDTFMISDQNDQPLDEAGESRLLQAVTERLTEDEMADG